MKAVLAQKSEKVNIHKGAIHLFNDGNTLSFSLFMENKKVISFAGEEMVVFTVDRDHNLITTWGGFRSVYKMEDEENE